MALYNNLTGADVRNQACSIAADVERNMARYKYFADQLNGIPADDLTSLGLSGDYQANLGSMKSDLLALEAWYRLNCQFVKRFANLIVM